ncbi:MAG: DUF4410 domain-containing protein [Acetobacteraceae bacterium]
MASPTIHSRRTMLLLPFAAVACAKPAVQTVAGYTGPPLPYPARVLVYPLAVAPEDVQLDQGVTARLQRETSDVPLRAQEVAAARGASDAITQTLVKELRSYGLPADYAYGTALPPRGATMLIRGQLVALDEGNRTRRTLIGLGAGRSSVSADAQVLFSEDGRAPRFIEAMDATANSGRMPGMAETLGVGAAAGTLATSAAVGTGLHLVSETGRASDSGEATGLGKALARQIGRFCVAQGWIAPSAVPSGSLL